MLISLEENVSDLLMFFFSVICKSEILTRNGQILCPIEIADAI